MIKFSEFLLFQSYVFALLALMAFILRGKASDEMPAYAWIFFLVNTLIFASIGIFDLFYGINRMLLQ